MEATNPLSPLRGSPEGWGRLIRRLKPPANPHFSPAARGGATHAVILSVVRLRKKNASADAIACGEGVRSRGRREGPLKGSVRHNRARLVTAVDSLERSFASLRMTKLSPPPTGDFPQPRLLPFLRRLSGIPDPDQDHVLILDQADAGSIELGL